MDFIDDDMRDIGKHSIALQPPQQNTSGAKSETCRAGYFRIQSDVVPDKRTITPDAVFFASFGRYALGDTCSRNTTWLRAHDIASTALLSFNGVVEKKLWYLSRLTATCLATYDDSIVRTKPIEKLVSQRTNRERRALRKQFLPLRILLCRLEVLFQSSTHLRMLVHVCPGRAQTIILFFKF